MTHVLKNIFAAVAVTGLLMASSLFFLTTRVNASSCELDKSGILGMPTWYKYLEGQTDGSGRCNPTIENTSASLPIGIAILELVLRVAGIVAVAMIFVGAFRFVTSAGNGEAAAGARKTVINALIGLVIVVISTAVVNYLGDRLS
jgi:hypothetical protein